MDKLTLTKKYDTYPRYKASGIEWAQKMPQDWNATFLRAVAQENRKKNKDGSNQNLLSLSYGKIITKDINGVGGLLPESFNTYQVVQKEDIIMRLTDLQNDKKSLRVGIVDEKDGIITSAYLGLKFSPNIDKKFAYYLLHSYDLQKVFYNLGGGVRQVLDYKSLKYLPIFLPELDLQKRIVDFLDNKTVLIDSVIEKKKKQIELLREKRAAFVDHILASVEGETGKLKNYAVVNPSKGSIVADPDSAVSFVPMEALSETGVLTLREKKFSEVKNGFTHFRENDVVIAKITPCFENGKAGVMRGLLNGFGFGTTEFIVLRPSEKILPDYLYYIVFSDKFRKLGEVGMRGSAGQKRVTNSFVANYEIKVPNLEEQKRIVSEIETKTKVIDSAITKVETTVEFLAEFKSSLISHAVTGKIRI